MTENAFLGLIRQYSVLASRKKVSYADAVGALVSQRAGYLIRTIEPGEALDAALAGLSEVVSREYGVNDNLWVDGRGVTSP